MLAHKRFHHSSLLLHKIAIESFKSHCRTINSNCLPKGCLFALASNYNAIEKKHGYCCDIQCKIITKIMPDIIY